jgi:hypothetical protein
MASCDPSALVQAGVKFSGLSTRYLELVKVELLCLILRQSNPMASCDPNVLLEAGKCLQCLGTQQMQVVQTQLLCEILQGGGSGATCIIGCANTGPIIPGPCPFSLAYSPGPNPGFWLWDQARAVWDEIVAPGP